MQDKNQQPYFELTETILGCCFDIMNELGSGFLESVYKNALIISLKEKGFKVIAEKKFEVSFRGRLIGVYIADLVIEESVIVELKCCEALLVNFGKRKIEYKRLHHPAHPAACDPAHLVF